MATLTTINKIKKGSYFRFKDSETAPVYVRSDYDRSSNSYEYYSFDDIYMFGYARKTRKVYVDFYFQY